MSVHRVGEPSRIDSRWLEWIGRLDVAGTARKRMHDSYRQASSIVVDDLICSYGVFCQPCYQRLLLSSETSNNRGI